MDYGSPPTPPPVGFKDRRTGLLLFGILSLIVGGICALAAMLTPLGLLMARAAPRPAGVPAPDLRSLFAAVLLYALIAAVFIWAGVGSVRAKRWVRPVMVSVGWTWLLLGVSGMVYWLLALGDIDAIMAASNPGGPPLPAGLRTAVVAFVTIFMAVIYLVVPGLYVWFYRSPHVRATLDHYDPSPAWTDRCPQPVLALSVGLGFAAVLSLTFLPYAVFPAFGVILTGPAAIAVILASAVVLAWLAWETFLLKPRAWWATIALSILLPLAAGVTLLRVNPLDLYRAAGFPEEQLVMLGRMQSLHGPGAAIVTLVVGAACLAYVVYLRKHFFAPIDRHSTPEQAI